MERASTCSSVSGGIVLLRVRPPVVLPVPSADNAKRETTEEMAEPTHHPVTGQVKHERRYTFAPAVVKTEGEAESGPAPA